jgi:ParB family chromosome partitioning protein
LLSHPQVWLLLYFQKAQLDRCRPLPEALVRNLLASKDKPSVNTQVDPNIRQLQDDLSQKIGAKVQIQHTAKGKGKLVLNYNSLDELDGILDHIK